MEHVYGDGERQGSMGRTYGRLCEPIHDIATLFRMWCRREKRPIRTVAQLLMRDRTGQGHQLSKAHLEPGLQTTLGRDAANVGNGVEASAFYAGVRPRQPAGRVRLR